MPNLGITRISSGAKSRFQSVRESSNMVLSNIHKFASRGQIDMFLKTRSAVFLALVILATGTVASYGQKARGTTKVPWKLTVVVMDGNDQSEQAEVPASEAIEFIEAHSRFKFEVEYVTASSYHEFTPYDGEDMTRYAMMAWNIPDNLIESLPVSSSYLFLYKLYWNEPAQAGSALGLDFGIIKGGKPRPYATVPTDQRWYVNTPNQGFKSWAAQVLAHEIINTIQAKIEAAPYKCGQMVGTHGARGDEYESQRLASLPDACYDKLGDNAD